MVFTIIAVILNKLDGYASPYQREALPFPAEPLNGHHEIFSYPDCLGKSFRLENLVVGRIPSGQTLDVEQVLVADVLCRDVAPHGAASQGKRWYERVVQGADGAVY